MDQKVSQIAFLDYLFSGKWWISVRFHPVCNFLNSSPLIRFPSLLNDCIVFAIMHLCWWNTSTRWWGCSPYGQMAGYKWVFEVITFINRLRTLLLYKVFGAHLVPKHHNSTEVGTSRGNLTARPSSKGGLGQPQLISGRSPATGMVEKHKKTQRSWVVDTKNMGWWVVLQKTRDGRIFGGWWFFFGRLVGW